MGAANGLLKNITVRYKAIASTRTISRMNTERRIGDKRFFFDIYASFSNNQQTSSVLTIAPAMRQFHDRR
jgi:hypothetical protein